MGAESKVCCICGKDVSNARRVKDPRGHYYCQACHEAALQRSAAAKPAATSEAADAGESRPGAAVATAAPPQKLPEVCPNCGARVLPNRKFCIRCQRDVTKMDKLIALRAEAEKGSAEQKLGAALGKGLKIGLWVLAIAVLAFGAYGVKMFFTPHGPFDDYPTTREAAIREYLGHIAKGTDGEYEKAFLLVSFRARTTNNTNEIAVYRRVFGQMRDDFVKKYGADWLSTVKIEKLGSDDLAMDEVTAYTMTVGGDEYHITTQVQIPVNEMIGNLATPRSKPVYEEDGKNRFGVLEVLEYPPHPKAKAFGGGGGD